MSHDGWMIYGAYGYTGTLIAEEAVRRGHKPLLCGRSAEKLAQLSNRLGLEQIPIDLVDHDRLHRALDGLSLVLNAAGPFVHTATILVDECMNAGTSYLDISGEPLVIEKTLALDGEARERGIVIIPGVGFNVLASDCLARYVAEQVENPTHLEIATRWITEGTSPGSTKTMIETFPLGTIARRDGQLATIDARAGRRTQRLLDGVSTILPVPLGDLATAYRTTQIPNITTYTAVSERLAKSYSFSMPIFRTLYSVPLFRRMACKWIDLTASRSTKAAASSEKAQAWVSVRNSEGTERQAWLETVGSYQFTAEAAVRSAERVLADHPVSALTPSMAFGADFVLEIPGSRRRDQLEDD